MGDNACNRWRCWSLANEAAKAPKKAPAKVWGAILG
jgi:hypothetical protein